MDKPPPPLTEAERLDAALATLLAERARRRHAAGREVTVTVIDEGKKLSEFAEEAPQEFKYPPELIEIHVITPEPQIELPGEQWDQPDARDITPPWRPPMPAAAPASPPTPAPPQPTGPPSNAGIPPQIHARELRRLARFESDEYSPEDAPLRYPRRNRFGF